MMYAIQYYYGPCYQLDLAAGRPVMTISPKPMCKAKRREERSDLS